MKMKPARTLFFVAISGFFMASCGVSRDATSNSSTNQKDDNLPKEAVVSETSNEELSENSNSLLELFKNVLQKDEDGAEVEVKEEGDDTPAQEETNPTVSAAEDQNIEEAPEFCKITEPNQDSLRAKFAIRLNQYVDIEEIKTSMKESCLELRKAMKAAKEELEEGDSILAVGLFAVSLKSGFGWMLMSYNDYLEYQAEIAEKCHELTKGKEQRLRKRGECALELRQQGWGVDEETGEQIYPDYIKSLHVQISDTDNEISRKSFALGAVAQTTIQGPAAEIITGGSSFYAAVGAGAGLAVKDDVTNSFYYAVGLGFIDTLGNQYANAVGGAIAY